jgi:hypothetical protein
MSESINFVLKTTDISSDNNTATYYGLTVINNIGSVSKNRTSLTWNNVNLRMLLGEMYDRYDKFNLSLNFVAGTRSGTVGETNLDARLINVRLRGLNFTSSYNQPSGNNNNSIFLTTLQLPTNTTPWANNYLTQQYFTFQKQETATITIDLLSVATDTNAVPATETSMLGHTIYGFNIYGCDEYKNTKNDLNTNLDIRKIF